MVLAGLVAALKIVGGNLADHKFLFLGAGEVCPYDYKITFPSFYWVLSVGKIC